MTYKSVPPTTEDKLRAIWQSILNESKHYRITTDQLSDLVIATLREGKELVQTCGWTRLRSGNRSQGLCIVGAIYEQKGQAFVNVIATQAMSAATGEDRDVMGWNDVQGRTKEEVLELFDKGTTLMEELVQKQRKSDE